MSANDPSQSPQVSDVSDAPPMVDAFQGLNAWLQRIDTILSLLQEKMAEETDVLAKVAAAQEKWNAENPEALHFPPLRSTNVPAYQAERYSRWPLQEIVDPEKGRAILATRALEVGEILLVESPILFRSPEEYKPLKEKLQEFFPGISLALAAIALPEAEQALILDMFNAFSSKAEAWALRLKELEDEGILPSLGGQSRRVAEFLGISRSNAFSKKEGELRKHGLWPLAARISHSCGPNARFTIEGETIFIHAIKPIAQGEEIVHSYLSEFTSDIDRRTQIHANLGFWCICPKCLKEFGPPPAGE